MFILYNRLVVGWLSPSGQRQIPCLASIKWFDRTKGPFESFQLNSAPGFRSFACREKTDDIFTSQCKATNQQHLLLTNGKYYRFCIQEIWLRRAGCIHIYTYINWMCLRNARHSCAKVKHLDWLQWELASVIVECVRQIRISVWHLRLV